MPARPSRACCPRPSDGPRPAPAQPQVVMPDAEKIVLLLRTTLNTLNDALQTGNFTVLRDMGAPGFRDANSAAGLSQAFSELALKKLDLSAVSVIAPELTQPPALDQAKSILHLKGYFPGNSVQINFDVLYQAVDGRWRVYFKDQLLLETTPPVVPAPLRTLRRKHRRAKIRKNPIIVKAITRNDRIKSRLTHDLRPSNT